MKKEELEKMLLKQWQEALDEMDSWAGGEIFDKNPSKEAELIAQDICRAAGWLVAIGAEKKLPSYWPLTVGGRVALTAGKAVINDLQKLKKDCSKLLKVPPPAELSPKEKILYILEDFIDADEEEILYCRLYCWAASVAIRQSSNCEPLGHFAYKAAAKLDVRLTIADDPGAQYVRLLSLLEQAEADLDETLVNPIISSWLQEEISQAKQEPLVKAAAEAGIADLPNIFL